MERIEAGQPFNVFVDYAHTADALRHALVMLRALTKGRLIVVFGCSGERDPAERPLMVQAVQPFADFALATADNPRGESVAQIFADMQAGVTAPAAITWIGDRRRAIRPRPRRPASPATACSSPARATRATKNLPPRSCLSTTAKSPANSSRTKLCAPDAPLRSSPTRPLDRRPMDGDSRCARAWLCDRLTRDSRRRNLRRSENPGPRRPRFHRRRRCVGGRRRCGRRAQSVRFSAATSSSPIRSPRFTSSPESTGASSPAPCSA